VLSEQTGLLAAPLGRAHEEGHLLGWEVGPVGLAAPVDLGPGLNDRGVDVELDRALPDAGVDVLTDEAPRDRVEPPARLGVAVGPDLGAAPCRQFEGRHG
jgi:hypothetical protein